MINLNWNKNLSPTKDVGFNCDEYKHWCHHCRQRWPILTQNTAIMQMWGTLIVMSSSLMFFLHENWQKIDIHWLISTTNIDNLPRIIHFVACEKLDQSFLSWLRSKGKLHSRVIYSVVSWIVAILPFISEWNAALSPIRLLYITAILVDADSTQGDFTG